MPLCSPGVGGVVRGQLMRNMAVLGSLTPRGNYLSVSLLSGGNGFISKSWQYCFSETHPESEDEAALLTFRCVECSCFIFSPPSWQMPHLPGLSAHSILFFIFPQVSSLVATASRCQGDFPLPTCWLQTQVFQPVMVPAHQMVFFWNFSALRFQTPLSKGSNCFTSQVVQLLN